MPSMFFDSDAHTFLHQSIVRKMMPKQWCIKRFLQKSDATQHIHQSFAPKMMRQRWCTQFKKMMHRKIKITIRCFDADARLHQSIARKKMWHAKCINRFLEQMMRHKNASIDFSKKWCKKRFASNRFCSSISIAIDCDTSLVPSWLMLLRHAVVDVA